MKIRLLADGSEVAEAVLRPSIPLSTAMLCGECEALYEVGSPNTCPRCGSAQAMPLARALNRQPVAEENAQ